jgi:regulator of cell morphogenesis and NO signaling
MKYLNYTIRELLNKNKHLEKLLNGLGIDPNVNLDRNLLTVLNEKKISPDAVTNTMELLQRQPDSDVDWILSPVSALTNHIQEYYHRRHRLQLPELIHTAEFLEARFANIAEYPKGLKKLLQNLYSDLIPHMENEERIIFPMLAENKGDYIYCQVSTIMHHHDHQFYILEAIKKLTDNFSVPEGADFQWKEFYQKISEFKNELLEHIRLENEILFATNTYGSSGLTRAVAVKAHAR